MPIYALDHVQLAMPRGQEDQARRFYGDILGLTEVAKPEPLAQRGGVWFEAGSLKLHLGIEDPFAPARKAHPALLTSDLAVLVEQCTKAGLQVIHDNDLPGYQRVYVADPFGNRLELLQPED